MAVVKVFVYGTLRSGGRYEYVVNDYVLAREPYEVNGRLYDVGTYPALVVDSAAAGVVKGELLLVSEEALRPLDELENYYGEQHPDNEYERIWHKDGFYLYVWEQESVDALGLPYISSGDWIAHARENNK